MLAAIYKAHNVYIYQVNLYYDNIILKILPAFYMAADFSDKREAAI